MLKSFFKTKNESQEILESIKISHSLLEILETIYRSSVVLNKENPKILLNYIKALKRMWKGAIESQTEKESLSQIVNFTSIGQLKSKVWVLHTLKELKLFDLGQVFLCAGWCGSLAYLLLEDANFKINKIFNFDKDPLSVQISEDLNREHVQNDWKFKATVQDILDLKYDSAEFETLKKNQSKQKLVVSPDTIINTSCEHIKNLSGWWNKIPSQKLVILQSNNFFNHIEHINCVSNLNEFKRQIKLDVLFEGELDLGEYKRFMLIGRKKTH